MKLIKKKLIKKVKLIELSSTLKKVLFCYTLSLKPLANFRDMKLILILIKQL